MMEFEIAYWHWLVLGMILVGFEIFIPSFTVLWFGLGAFVVSACLWAAPDLDLSWQLFIWSLASMIFGFGWFKLFRPMMTDKTKAGIAREAIAGEIGMVVKKPTDSTRGRVRFTIPLLGDDEWEFICQETVTVGDKVVITEASGNTLMVDKVS